MKQKYFLLIIIFLILLLILRIIPRNFFKQRYLFKDKNIVGVELADKVKLELIDKDRWVVIVDSKTFKADIHQVNNLLASIREIRVLESVSNKLDSYKEYEVDDKLAVKATIFISRGNKITSKTIFLGKPGGFSYSELYMRLDKDPNVYLAKGMNKWLFYRPFDYYCDKTILKCDIDNIDFVNIQYDKKLFDLKKDLKNSTTVWVDLRNNKIIDNLSVGSFLKNFEDLIADTIIYDKFFQLEKNKKLLDIKLRYHDNTEVKITVYNKNDATFGFYPLEIDCNNRNSFYVKNCGDKEVVYAIKEEKYKEITKFK